MCELVLPVDVVYYYTDIQNTTSCLMMLCSIVAMATSIIAGVLSRVVLVDLATGVSTEGLLKLNADVLFSAEQPDLECGLMLIGCFVFVCM